MWWIPLATAAVSGYLGHKQQQEQERARGDQALINMYSPIFGGSPQALGMRQNYTMPGAISGFLEGMSIMDQLEKKEKASDTSSASSDPSTDVFIPYAQSPNMSMGAPAVSPYTYRPRYTNPWGQS